MGARCVAIKGTAVRQRIERQCIEIGLHVFAVFVTDQSASCRVSVLVSGW